MANKKKNEDFVVVYVDDTKNFHTYQVAPGQVMYGSFGFSKEAASPSDGVPKKITLELIPKTDKRWKPAMESLISKARPGNRRHDRLTASLSSS